MLRPALILGLGDLGSKLAPRLLGCIGRRDTACAAAVRVVQVDPSAPWWAASLAEPGTPSGETASGGGSVPAGAAALRQALLDQRATLDTEILRAVVGVRDHARSVEMERNGHNVADELVVVILGPLSDPVASAALPVVLSAWRELLRNTLRDLPAEIHLTLLMPDLMAEEPDPLAHARAYATLQELEAGLDDGPGVAVDGVWLFSRRSTADRFVGREDELSSVLEEHTWCLLRGYPPVEGSTGPSLHQRIAGRTTRYCAFGCSRLRFPRDELMSAVSDTATAASLRAVPELDDRRFPADSVYPLVGSFVAREDLSSRGRTSRPAPPAGLPVLLAETADGLSLRRPFQPPGPGEPGDDLLARLEAYASAYASAERGMRGEMAMRSEELKREMERALREAVAGVVADAERGGTLGAAHAWLSAALGEGSRYLEGEVSRPPDDNVRAVLDALEDRLYHLMFGPERDPQLREYLREHPEAPENRRALLRYLRGAVDARTRQQHQLRAAMRRLQADLERARAEISDAGGASDSAAPDPISSASAEIEIASQEQNLATARAELEACTQALDLTRGLHATARAEVDRLDRALHDPVVRWDRFRAQEAELRAVVEGASRAYDQAEAALAEAQRVLEGARLRLQAWSAAAAPLAVAVGGGIGVQLGDLGLASGAMFLLILAGAAVVWVQAGRSYRDARDGVRAARRDRLARGQEVVGSWTALTDRRFEHLRFSHIADWCRWLPSLIRSQRGSVERLGYELGRAAKEAEERAAVWEPASNAFVENLIPQGGVAGLVGARTERLRARATDFWRQKPFSAWLGEYLDAPVVVGRLVAELRAWLEEVFADLREMSVEQFFAAESGTPEQRQRLVNRLYRTAAPLSKTVFRQAEFQTPEIGYAALADTTEQSPVREVLLQMGLDSMRCYGSRTSTEVTVSRVQSGMAVFQVAAVHEAFRHLAQLDDDARVAVYASPVAASSLPPLLPNLRAGRP